MELLLLRVATELMLRAARVPPRGAAASLLEVLPRPSSRCCQQYLEEGLDEEDQLSANRL